MVELTLLNELLPLLPFTLVSLDASGYFFMFVDLFKKHCGKYSRRHILLKGNAVKPRWPCFCGFQYVEQKVFPFFLSKGG